MRSRCTLAIPLTAPQPRIYDRSVFARVAATTSILSLQFTGRPDCRVGRRPHPPRPGTISSPN
jgi:hypothetical protein